MKPVGITAKIIPDKRTHRFAHEILNRQLEETPLVVASMEENDLWERAVDNWLDHRSTLLQKQKEQWSNSLSFQQRIQVNYLRHCGSNYDEIRGNLADKQIRKITLQVLNKLLKDLVLLQIEKQYPCLREEVHKQLVENKKKNHR